MTREDVERWVEENDIELSILEGMDNAILGIADDGLDVPRLAYSKRKIIDILVKQGMDEEGALEWYSYNTARAIPYMGSSSPIVIDDLWFDTEDSKVVN